MDNIDKYQSNLSNALLSYDANSINVLSAADETIDSLATHIIQCIHSSASATLPCSKFNKHAKPYWTPAVREAHTLQRRLRRSWISEGRPRGNIFTSYREYKQAKRAFKTVQNAASRSVEQNLYNELNYTAECDIRLFWSKVRSLNNNHSKLITGIRNAGGTHCNTPPDIATAFCEHYSALFIPVAHPEYDESFAKTATISVTEYLTSDFNNDCTSLNNRISYSDISNAGQRLKTKKAPGKDAVVSEHILFGGPTLLFYLELLFNAMLENQYTPSILRIGLVVPILKEGKPKDLPGSYRPITLLSVIYKMFETILKSRIDDHIDSKMLFPNPQQNGYQKHLGSITASFNLQETIWHNRELGSDTFVAMMDAASAFDGVWHTGLFLKMLNINIKGKALVWLINTYENMTSAVLVNGVESPSFPVRQGVRQGSVLSSWCYALYINELLDMLCNSNLGTVIGSIPCCSPTLADDLSLVANSILNLKSLLDIVTAYANKWRYKFNQEKCSLQHFSGNTRNVCANTSMIPFKLSQTSKHLGIHLQKDMRNTTDIVNRCDKGRKSFFSILSLDKGSHQLNPLVIASLVEKVTMPTVLYGSELWSSLLEKDMHALNVLQRLFAKTIQKLPIRTRTNIALPMLGWLPISAQIEKRKLVFLQKLCTMPVHLLSRRIFNMRLFTYVQRNDTSTQGGFIPDIFKITSKYGLLEHLQLFIRTSTFPAKGAWNNIVVKSISDYHERLWSETVLYEPCFRRFAHLHCSIAVSWLWKLPSYVCTIRNKYTIAQAWAYIQYDIKLCIFCNNTSNDINRHLVVSCPHFNGIRSALLSSILASCPEMYYAFHRMVESDEETAYVTFLGSTMYLPINTCSTIQYLSILTAILAFVAKVLQAYKRRRTKSAHTQRS